MSASPTAPRWTGTTTRRRSPDSLRRRRTSWPSPLPSTSAPSCRPTRTDHQPQRLSGRPAMAVNAPTPAQLRAVAEDLGLSLTDADIDFHIASMAGTVGAYQAIDALPDHLPEVKYPRAGGYRPGHHENRLNAWAWKASIKGKPRGPLAGKTVV